MAKFVDFVRDKRLLSADEQREFDNIQIDCGHIATSIGGTTRNLEHLASFLATLKIVRPEHRFGGNTVYQTPESALDLVVRCICKLASPQIDENQVGKLASLMTECHNKDVDLSIVTTNYDLHAEYAAIRQGIKINPGESILLKRKYNAQYSVYSKDPSAIPLVKLHGSVNWLNDSSGELCVEDRFFREYKSNPAVGTFQPLESMTLDNQNAIVAPTVLKTSVPRVFEEQWRRAASLLQHADKVCFIGYSFPESDTHMRYFLAASMFGNARIRQILAIDPDPDAIVRASQVFGSPFLTDVFSGHEVTFENISPSGIYGNDARKVDQISNTTGFRRDEKLKNLLVSWLSRQMRD